MFKKYQKIERLGRSATIGITEGICHIFPKLDGTNAQVWLEDGKVCAGSRNRELSESKDNAGFYKSITKDNRIIAFLNKHSNLRLYGEWLVPHTIKKYKEDSWNNFYVFDIMNGEQYLTYDEYVPLLDEFGISYIPRISVFSNPTIENIATVLKTKSNFLLDSPSDAEGIVIKNYSFVNRFGNTIWAKVINKSFDNGGNNKKSKKVDNGNIYSKIQNEYLKTSFYEKEFQKIKTKKNGFTTNEIPMFMGIVWHEFLIEEMPEIIKRFKNPIIDFKKVHHIVTSEAREFLIDKNII